MILQNNQGRMKLVSSHHTYRATVKCFYYFIMHGNSLHSGATCFIGEEPCVQNMPLQGIEITTFSSLPHLSTSYAAIKLLFLQEKMLHICIINLFIELFSVPKDSFLMFVYGSSSSTVNNASVAQMVGRRSSEEGVLSNGMF